MSIDLFLLCIPRTNIIESRSASRIYFRTILLYFLFYTLKFHLVCFHLHLYRSRWYPLIQLLFHLLTIIQLQLFLFTLITYSLKIRIRPITHFLLIFVPLEYRFDHLALELFFWCYLQSKQMSSPFSFNFFRWCRYLKLFFNSLFFLRRRWFNRLFLFHFIDKTS